MILLERKLLALSQRRVGPVMLGNRGFLQIIADTTKPLFKEIFEQRAQSSALLAVSVFVYFFIQLFIADLLQFSAAVAVYTATSLVFFLQLFFSGASCFFIVIIGYFTGSKYSAISAVRLVVCELSSNASYLYACYLLFSAAGGAEFAAVSLMQASGLNFFFLASISGIFQLFSTFIAAQRAPADLVEAEGELVAGYNIEYSGADVLLIYFAEYLHLFNAAAM